MLRQGISERAGAGGFRLVLLLAVAALILAVTAGGAVGAVRPTRLAGGDPLQRLRSEDRLGGARVAPTVVTVGLPRRTALIWLVLASVSLLAVAAPAAMSKRPLRLAQAGVPSPEGGVQMRKFIDRKVERETQGEDLEEAVAQERGPEAPSPVSRVADYTGEPVAAPDARRRASGPEASFGELGQHVASVLEAAREAAERMLAEATSEAARASVLEAAREAAERMLAEATSEAARVQERSQKEADAVLAEARRKTGELEAEASQTRSEAKRVARELHARADAYSEEKRQEADEAAAQVVARAERAARERAAAAEERQRALDEHVERTEERLRQLAGGLRDLAGRLDVLVGSDRPRPEEPQPASLDEELRPSAAAARSPHEAEVHADRAP